jgi:uncharacterized protein
MHEHAAAIAADLGLAPAQVERTLALAADGATVPFLARYRKEATGGLDEVQLRAILDAAAAREELESRRDAILASLAEHGKLTPELERAVKSARTRTELEDLYLPHRPKRRTRATIARERGLAPLAERIWAQRDPPGGDVRALAAPFVDPGKDVPDADAALAGARDIVAERVAEDPPLRAASRAIAGKRATLRSTVAPAKQAERTRFESWYDHEEPIGAAPSHRILALLRGEAEEVLRVKVALPEPELADAIAGRVTGRRSAWTATLREATEDAVHRLLGPSLENELRGELKARADREAVEIFAKNLRDLLLAPPAGTRPVIALDPGLRTGTKAATLDATGRVLATATLYTERSPAEREAARRAFGTLVERHRPELVAVGNGTGSREAEAFVREALAAAGKTVPIVSVSEQGASVYSASDAARAEFPELDVSLRGAISIGRRLQDPLAELVKIDPKSIGVGQYQHDVEPSLLAKKLGEVVDSCVNAVGVDANTASAALLEHVSGIGPSLAKKLVAHRDEKGAFPDRKALRKVSGFGPKTFEQAAGFLRIRGENPLDDSAVHPERYAVVEAMAKDLGVPVRALVGDAALVRRIDPTRYRSADLGEPTLRDILAELAKPGRDPRGDFTAPAFRADLTRLEDVKEGMVLDGVVTNVTAFGAFVDVGVHQDGLVHLSQLAARYVKDPAEVVRVGERVRVKVISVDLARKRLGLSIKALATPAPEGRR